MVDRPPPGRTCFTCDAWHNPNISADYYSSGNCRLRAPQHLRHLQNWPETSGTDWCLEWVQPPEHEAEATLSLPPDKETS